MGRSTVLGFHLPTYMHHLIVHQWFHSISSRSPWIYCFLMEHFNHCINLDNSGHVITTEALMFQALVCPWISKPTDMLNISSSNVNSPIYWTEIFMIKKRNPSQKFPLRSIFFTWTIWVNLLLQLKAHTDMGAHEHTYTHPFLLYLYC